MRRLIPANCQGKTKILTLRGQRSLWVLELLKPLSGKTLIYLGK
ncbi:MAG: hypothetical protein AB1589_44685 [Cyanobacteriota bacterium]